MKVIIVDDERNARESLQTQMLEIPQITDIQMFGNPYKALNYVKEHPVDIAFLDVEMPELNGMEMAIRLKAINPTINIVYITGYAQYGAEAFETDASDFLLKPATVERIQQSLSRLRNPVVASRIRVRCFGNFEVYADGEQLHFPRKKAKEVFAYLIHKNGTSCTIKELASALLEDKSDGNLHMQTHITTMIKVFDECGAKDVIMKGYNSYAVDTKKVDCDLYRSLAGDKVTGKAFVGEYMASYTWAEGITAYLVKQLM